MKTRPKPTLLHRQLALLFLKETGYKPKDFKKVDFGTILEEEVCQFLEGRHAKLLNWRAKEWTYKEYVYQEVLNLLKIPEKY